MRFSSTLGALALATGVLSKELTGVFTAIESITNAGNSITNQPFDWWNVVMAWSIDTSTAATGDTFSLTMPYVYELTIIDSAGFLSNAFDITSDDETIASCTVDPAGGRSLSTLVTCQITADLSSYSGVVSGTVGFEIVFDGGARTETTEAAQQWTTGENTVTWNDDLTATVTFDTTNIISAAPVFLTRTTMRGDTFYYFLGQVMCGSSDVASGTLTFTTSSGANISATDLEVYLADQVNAFGEPVDSTSLTYSVEQTSPQSLAVTFGDIPASQRLWASFFGSPITYDSYTIGWAFDIVCGGTGPTAGSNAGVADHFTLTPIAFSGDGDAMGIPSTVTLTTTGTGTGCEPATKFVTGTDSTVTEIVETPSATTCSSSTTVTTTTTGSSTASSTATTSTSSSTATTSTSQPSLIVIETITISTQGASTTTASTTTTEQWSGSYTSTITESITSGETVVTADVESTTASTTTSETLSGSYTSSSSSDAISSTRGSSSANEISSASYASSFTEPISSGDTYVTVVVGTTSASTTTESLSGSGASATSSFTEPISSGEPSSGFTITTATDEPLSGSSTTIAESVSSVVETPVVSSDQSSAPGSSTVPWNQTYTIPSSSKGTPSGSTLITATTEPGIVTSAMIAPSSTDLLSTVSTSVPSSNTKAVQVPTESSFAGVSSPVPVVSIKSTSSGPHAVSTGTSASEPQYVASSPAVEPSTITYTTGTITATVVVSIPPAPSVDAQTSVSSSPSSSSQVISVFEGMGSVRSASLFTMFAGFVLTFMI